jgi:hypothetical protein
MLYYMNQDLIVYFIILITSVITINNIISLFRKAKNTSENCKACSCADRRVSKSSDI